MVEKIGENGGSEGSFYSPAKLELFRDSAALSDGFGLRPSDRIIRRLQVRIDSLYEGKTSEAKMKLFEREYSAYVKTVRAEQEHLRLISDPIQRVLNFMTEPANYPNKLAYAS